MLKKLLIIPVFLIVVSWGAIPACADEILEAMTEAIEAYKEKEYSEAAESLDYAKQLIQQLRSENIMKVLPEPLPGWESKTAQTQSMGMLGGMTGVEKKYSKPGTGNQGSKNITINIMAESPMMQGMMTMFNPAYAGAQGGKLQKIKRNKAMVKYDPDSRRGEANIMVDKRYIVSIKGNSIDKEDLMNYAEAVDYKALKDL
ncbi:MAG: hypothetical protein PVH37_21810 [Desulfobacterales bacterium]|jgi:hypothetical protein